MLLLSFSKRRFVTRFISLFPSRYAKNPSFSYIFVATIVTLVWYSYYTVVLTVMSLAAFQNVMIYVVAISVVLELFVVFPPSPIHP